MNCASYFFVDHVAADRLSPKPMASSPEKFGAHQAVGSAEAKDGNKISIKGLVALPRSVLHFAIREVSMLEAFALLVGLVLVLTAPICIGIIFAVGGSDESISTHHAGLHGR